MQNNDQDKKMSEIALKVVQEYNRTTAFSGRTLADTPTDKNMVTPRGYVNMNGLLASRPTSSVATDGQSYFASDTKIPMTFYGGQWYNGVGSVVAST